MTITAKHQILIVGGGTAGITVAARMLRKGYTDVAVIEPSSTHYYQPLWTLVGGGQAKASTTERAESSVMPKGRRGSRTPPAPLIPTTTRSPAPTGRPTATTCSSSVPASSSTGTAPRDCEDALGRDGVSSNYRFDLAPRTWEFIRDPTFGHSGVHGSVRCDQVRRSAAEDRLPGAATTGESKAYSTTSTSTWSCRAPRPFGIPAIADSLDAVIADYGITLHTNSEVTSVDAASHKVGITSVGAGRDRHHAALRRAARRATAVGAGLDQVQPAVDRRCDRLRRDRQAHHAARAVPQRVQPR